MLRLRLPCRGGAEPECCSAGMQVGTAPCGSAVHMQHGGFVPTQPGDMHHVQAREGSTALQRYAAQLRFSDAGAAQRALARLRWLTLSIGLVWGLIILAFLSFLRRQGWLDGQAAAGKDSKSTV